jgi:hypothetical protein
MVHFPARLAGHYTKLEIETMLDMPTTREEWQTVWQHFNRMQNRVMSTHTSKTEFFAEPESERWEFYRWLCQQCPNCAWI